MFSPSSLKILHCLYNWYHEYVLFNTQYIYLKNFISKVDRWGEVAQSCPTLCDPIDCNLLGFSVHGILQARIQEWIAISFSRGSSRPRDRTRVSCIGGRRFNLSH